MSATQIIVIVVDPDAKSVHVDVIDGELETMRQLVGGEPVWVSMPFGDGVEMLGYDKDGRNRENYHFRVRGLPDIFSGKAVISRKLDTTEGVLYDDTALDAETVSDLITWLPHLDNQALQ